MAMLDSFTDLIGLGGCGRLGRESICLALNQKSETQVLTPAVPGVLLCDPGLATFPLGKTPVDILQQYILGAIS